MRISDWSSDVCSSDLAKGRAVLRDGAVAIDDDHLPAPAQRRAQPPEEGVGLADLVIHMDHENAVEAVFWKPRIVDRAQFQRNIVEPFARDAIGGALETGRTSWRERGGQSR